MPSAPFLTTGSWDGFIRIWTIDASFRSFEAIMTIPAAGFVNGLQLMTLPAKSVPLGEHKAQIILAAAISSEPRLGRWFTSKVKTGVLVACIQ